MARGMVEGNMEGDERGGWWVERDERVVEGKKKEKRPEKKVKMQENGWEEGNERKKKGK
jgi:hypothetical protein